MVQGRVLCALALSLWVAHAGAADPGTVGEAERVEDETFDAFEGMDRNGRIPRPERPEELPNPERWRYLPEARIKPGNVLERFMVTSVIAPFVFYDSDVGTGFGISLIDIDFRERRRQEFAGLFLSYTTEGQQNYTFVWRHWLHHREAPGGGVFQEERSFLRAAWGYNRALTRRFFGLGPRTREEDETSYRDESFFLEVELQRAWPDPGDPLVWSLGVTGETHSLGPGHVSGEPDTKQAFPEIFDEADPAQLGWLTGGVRWDTRDSQRNPYRGYTIGADVAAALLQDRGDVGAVFGLGGSRYFPTPPIFHDGGDPDEENPPTDVFAVGGFVGLASGNLPFFALPSLGGSNVHRGFIAGRWRDRASWFASAEYRFWVLERGFGIPFTETIRVERVGLAAFYEAGSVARNEGDLFQTRVRHSYGVGLRVTLERAAPFRVDLGFSEDGLNVSAGFGLSF